MAYRTIRLARDPRGVATLTLARAEKHNALDATMIAELTEAAAALCADSETRVVVLTGEGRSFCAGGDLGWMRDQAAADRATRMAEARKLAGMLQALDRLPQPLIGRVQGQAYGGGIGMISVCDTAVAVERARFGLTETRLGLIPATIGPYVLSRLGYAGARAVFFSARIFEAAEAVRLGLVARVVPEADLEDAIEAEIAPCLGAAPGAVANAKALLRRMARPVDPETVEHTVTALANQWETAEAAEGIAAFFEKRPPAWRTG